MLGGQINPQSNIVGALDEGVKTGLQLATASEQIEQKKIQNEQMKEQLESAKFNKAIGSLQTLAKTRPEIAKKMIPRIQQNLESAGIAVDPAILDVMASDPEYKRRLNALGDIVSGMANDPERRSSALAAINDLGMYSEGISALEKQQGQRFAQGQQKSAQEFQSGEAEKQRASQEKIAHIKGDQVSAQQDLRQERIDISRHNSILNRLNSKDINDQLKQIRNLSNAKAQILGGTKVTPQQLHELQQAVRSNLGIKGTGGVDERAATYFKNLGLKIAEVNQFFTAEPSDVNNFGNTEVLKHLMALVDKEIESVQSGVKKTALKASAGAESMYKKRPDLQSDLDSAIQKISESSSDSNPTPQRLQQSHAPQQQGQPQDINKNISEAFKRGATAAQIEAKIGRPLTIEEKKLGGAQ
jgi:hypothetical protein